jgi:hypothetical protein
VPNLIFAARFFSQIFRRFVLLGCDRYKPLKTASFAELYCVKAIVVFLAA